VGGLKQKAGGAGEPGGETHGTQVALGKTRMYFWRKRNRDDCTGGKATLLKHPVVGITERHFGGVANTREKRFDRNRTKSKENAQIGVHLDKDLEKNNRAGVRKGCSRKDKKVNRGGNGPSPPKSGASGGLKKGAPSILPEKTSLLGDMARRRGAAKRAA